MTTGALTGYARRLGIQAPTIGPMNPIEWTASEFNSARKFVNTSQGRIAHIDKGHGPEALFLHGFPLNSFQWRGVIPRLSAYRRCIAPDFLALGYTEVAAGQSVAPDAQVAMLGCVAKIMLRRTTLLTSFRYAAVPKRSRTNFA
jgi:pimeloyl-ACP methyl ester carboxylesterase